MRASWWLVALGILGVGLAGCPGDDGPNGGGGAGGSAPTEPAWQVVFDEGALDRAVLAVWGTSSTSVYAVGGPLQNSGFTALALHFDGTEWTDLDPGGADGFWWVHGTSDSDVWIVGENGRITHYDGSTFEEMDSGTTATLWGAIAFASDDVWVVGGEVGGPATQPDDVVLHYDGVQWTAEALPGEPLGRALFKVWGTSGEDLFVVGEAGVVWHRSAAGWQLMSDPPIASGNLTTVHGCSGTDVWAVGGRDLLRYDGSGWTRLDKSLGNDVNGVFCKSETEVAIVGMGGLKQRLDGETWSDDFAKDPHGNLHAVWSDETGAYWAVGGDFISSPKPNTARNGIVARYGAGTIPTKLVGP
ncbi:MAG: hypothetical protein U0271_18440 [Polyangiaceae bacterium]